MIDIGKNKRVRLWGLRNAVAAIATIAIFAAVMVLNKSYRWLWVDYTKANLESMRADRDLNNEEKLVRRLGIDYQFVLSVKGMTPENAVIYYPSREDFLATPTCGPKLPFRGTMVDKIAAIRVLYPRRVVTKEEMRQTPYSEQISHIAVVNGRNRDMVDYPCDTTVNSEVLPTNGDDYIPF